MKQLLIPIALALAASASHASPCDDLQAQIDAKIRAGGLSRFTLTTVDASASAPGKVVGTCEMGSKKIMFQVPDAPAGSVTSGASTPVARPPATRPRKDTVLTECRDGTVITNGDCKN